jgi:mono/diheme cytochrome c family protein
VEQNASVYSWAEIATDIHRAEGGIRMRKVLKWIGIVVGVLVLLIIVSGAVLYSRAGKAISAKVTVPEEQIAIPTDSASVARGRHVARALAKCADCHTEDLGGQVMIDDPAFGRIASANLTKGKGGIGSTRSDADIVRAIRHAVGPEGRKLLIMPSMEYNDLSAEDVGAVVAYIRSLPPVDREPPPMKFGPIFRMLVATNQMPASEADMIDHSKAPRSAPPQGVTAEYGKYLAEVSGCRGCHGPGYSGGPMPFGDPNWPPSANITPTGLKLYDEASFMKLLREGTRPVSNTPVNEAMPVKFTKEMTDDEIKALWAYLQTVPPKEYGSR